MATLKPFRALRPRANVALQVASPPYDVVSRKEATTLAEGNPLSFLRVIRSEIELGVDHNPYDPSVYRHARAKLEHFVRDEIFLRDSAPFLYVYQLQMGEHTQTGIAGCVSIDEYERGSIKIHERTRPDKEDDRTRHIETLEAQVEPVLLAYRARTEISHLIRAELSHKPLYNFNAPDGVRHTIWQCRESAAITQAFSAVSELYIADGHHRSASALRARKVFQVKNCAARGSEAYNYFLAVLFPDTELQILPYNRIIRPGTLLPEQVLSLCQERCDLQETATGRPARKGEIRMFVDGSWYKLTPPSKNRDQLDVDLLQETILGPVFEIEDQRTNKNIDFVGGIRGLGELERLVESGEACSAFSLYPVSLNDLFAVSDRGGIMPPKSTWFEPKLRSGLLVSPFRTDYVNPIAEYETL